MGNESEKHGGGSDHGLKRILGPVAARSVRVPGYPVVPLLFVLGELCILAGALFYSEQRITVLIGIGWILGATLLYFLFFYGGLSKNSVDL
ncbi:MAG: hypothetical protein IH984_04375 [Planctomycetes bacterium]|nr:hypothetical protein [Planctomycetota bacterium]